LLLRNLFYCFCVRSLSWPGLIGQSSAFFLDSPVKPENDEGLKRTATLTGGCPDLLVLRNVNSVYETGDTGLLLRRTSLPLVLLDLRK
jgi:hypothetical protein